MRRRHLTIFVVLASFAAIGYGFYIFEDEPKKGNTCIGAGTAGLFLLGMPLFLADVSRGKKAKDYMLTDENIRKMQGKEPKNPENQ